MDRGLSAFSGAGGIEVCLNLANWIKQLSKEWLDGLISACAFRPANSPSFSSGSLILISDEPDLGQNSHDAKATVCRQE